MACRKTWSDLQNLGVGTFFRVEKAVFHQALKGVPE